MPVGGNADLTIIPERRVKHKCVNEPGIGETSKSRRNLLRGHGPGQLAFEI